MAIRLFEQVVHAQLYSKFRPTYPKAVLDIISGFISKNGGRFGLAVDVACGSGQSTFYLRNCFAHCIGIDISKSQVAQAQKKCQEQGDPNVEFRVGDVADLPVEDGAVDLLTCAQAWHWIDPTHLYREASRVLKPKGCLAIYGYGNVQLINKECNELVSSFYWSTLKGYWHQNRKHINNLYTEVKLPYLVTERHDITSAMTMEVPHFIGYVSSWSGYQDYCEKNPGNKALEELQEKITGILQQSQSNMELEISFPVFVILGQKT